jgi:predicted metal-binding membrane protein
MAEIPRWRLAGDWFDVCRCRVPCGCTFAQAPDEEQCDGILAWHVREGNYGDVSLDGMMAAMMLPSVSPTVALYARMTRRRTRLAPFVFAAGYLATWTAAGLLAYGLFELGRSALGGELTWDGAGRWLAGGTLVLAAAYELTPMKDVCLAKCRSPLGFLLSAWRDGPRGAFAMGGLHGAWCVGCCWALMASLFALGVMSLAWMAFVAALIALEKTVPFGRSITYATAALLLVVGIALIAVPDAVPGLTIPGGGGAMSRMDAMPMR